MTTPTVPDEGTLGLSYELQIDVDMDYAAQAPTDTPDWFQLAFITNVQDPNTKNFAETTTYFNRGAKAQSITGEDWQLTFDHQLQRLTSGLYIPTLAALVEASKFGKRDKRAQGHFRWYDTEGADYAFEGTGYVSRTRTAAGNNDPAGFSFTITGNGAATVIGNPFSQPFITSVLPLTAAAGDQVTIKGAGFTGATVVKFGATNATSFITPDARTIVAVLPTGSAGAANVVVTSPAGTTAAFPYTRGA